MSKVLLAVENVFLKQSCFDLMCGGVHVSMLVRIETRLVDRLIIFVWCFHKARLSGLASQQ